MPSQHKSSPLSVRGLTGAERDALRDTAARDGTTVNALVLSAIRELLGREEMTAKDGLLRPGEPVNKIISQAVAEKLDREDPEAKEADMTAEKVTENYQPRPGQMAARTYWIAYPGHVAAYGHQADRIARAAGTGRTRKAALADAEAKAS